MAKKITTIPATLNKFTSTPVISREKRKVAGYARVSTGLEEQQSSYENQIEYYTNYITARDDWEFVEVYTDEGITATSTAHRDGFNRMIDDALAGKIDLIITKSVSRFARNTVDSLTTVRRLKEKGVEIYFEKENIWTLDSKGELLITIMSSLAQEESRSISENTTWGKRKSFADGQVAVAFTRFLGYDKGFVINEEEAKTVRMIYKLFLAGYSIFGIKRELEAQGRRTATGKTNWTPASIESILTNEKYKGDALLQKQYTDDFLTKKRKTNAGEIPQYYVEGHHEPIIAPDTFDITQAKFKEYKERKHRCHGTTIYNLKIKCGDCGNFFVPTTWHSTDKYRRTVFRCGRKYEDGNICRTPHLYLEDIQKAFITAVNSLIEEKTETVENLRMLQNTICVTDELKVERDLLAGEVAALEIQLRQMIAENAHVVRNQDEYETAYHEVYIEYEDRLNRLEELNESIRTKEIRRKMIDSFLDKFITIEGMLTAFDEELWGGLVDCMTVYAKDNIVFTFAGGLEVKI